MLIFEKCLVSLGIAYGCFVVCKKRLVNLLEEEKLREKLRYHRDEYMNCDTCIYALIGKLKGCPSHQDLKEWEGTTEDMLTRLKKIDKLIYLAGCQINEKNLSGAGATNKKIEERFSSLYKLCHETEGQLKCLTI